MNEEEIKKIWTASGTQYFTVDSETVKQLRTQVDRMDKVIRRRDWRESGAAVLVALAFGGMAFWFENVYTIAGCVLIVMASALILWVLRKSRKQETEEQLPIREHLQAELEFYRKQRQLLKHVLAWYILPIFAGLTLFYLGLTNGWVEFVAFSLLNVGVMAYIWYLNQQAVRKEIEPLITSLEQLQQNLENE